MIDPENGGLTTEMLFLSRLQPRYEHFCVSSAMLDFELLMSLVVSVVVRRSSFKTFDPENGGIVIGICSLSCPERQPLGVILPPPPPDTYNVWKKVKI